MRLAIAQTRNNKGEAVENANVSIQDIMKVSKTSRAGAVAIRKRMMSDGVIENTKETNTLRLLMQKQKHSLSES